MQKLIKEASREDLIFWATYFFQEKIQSTNPKEPPKYFLSDDGAKEIAECLTQLEYPETSESVQQIYKKRS